MKRMVVLCLVVVCSFGLYAQTVPVVDGLISMEEYSFTKAVDNVDIGLALSADKKVLYIAVEAETNGWLSVGLGSKKMDSAFMVFAYDKNGKEYVTEETGKGHRHTINKETILLSSVVKETDEKTVLEFSLPAKDFIKDGNIDLILAYGKRDSRISLHSWRSAAIRIESFLLQ